MIAAYQNYSKHVGIVIPRGAEVTFHFPFNMAAKYLSNALE